MGIQYLLRFMKPFIQPVHIGKYSGKRVGIDAYSWLHKGAYSCSMELYLDPSSVASSRYLRYFMHRINLLRHHGVIPVVVFDGGNIPSKSGTEVERQKKRDDNLALAKAKLEEGDVNAAIELFQRAISITPFMAFQLIQILRSEEVEYVVAPYEADAQLAYLSTLKENQGGIGAVITEDSDLMAYGCKAIIFKMDQYGKGEEVIMDDVFNSVSDGLSFKHIDKELFTGMCVLAGCDFLPSITGIGIKRAHTLVSKYRNLDRALSVIKYEKGEQVPKDYEKLFREAVAIFHHAKIYDAENKVIKSISPLPQKLLQLFDGNLDFLGPEILSSTAVAIAEGRINPITMDAFDCFPNATCQLNISSRAASGHLPKAKTQPACSQQSCFSLFSVDKTSGRNNTVHGVVEKILLLTDKDYSNEAAALAKLISPTDFHQESLLKLERRVCPNNNPFKKRRMVEDVSDPEVCINEKVSIACTPTEPCLANGSSDSEVASPAEDLTPSELREEIMVEVQSGESPDTVLFKKRKLVMDIPDSAICEVEHASGTTTNLTNDGWSSTPESQASVNSKPPVKTATDKGRSGKKANSKRSKRNSETANDTILRFFKRL